MKLHKNFFKRAIDIAASSGALLVLSVPLAAVTLDPSLRIKGQENAYKQRFTEKGNFPFEDVRYKQGSEGEYCSLMIEDALPENAGALTAKQMYIYAPCHPF